jgi:hypothetical protein
VKFSRSITLMLAGLAAIAALSGCGSNSNLTGLDQNLDTTPPPAPRNISLSSDAAGRALLVWDASAAPDVVGYQVQVLDPISGLFVSAGDPNTSDTNFQLPSVTSSVQESYRVRAVDGAGNWSAPSTTANVTVPGPGAPIGID